MVTLDCIHPNYFLFKTYSKLCFTVNMTLEIGVALNPLLNIFPALRHLTHSPATMVGSSHKGPKMHIFSFVHVIQIDIMCCKHPNMSCNSTKSTLYTTHIHHLCELRLSESCKSIPDNQSYMSSSHLYRTTFDLRGLTLRGTERLVGAYGAVLSSSEQLVGRGA